MSAFVNAIEEVEDVASILYWHDCSQAPVKVKALADAPVAILEGAKGQLNSNYKFAWKIEQREGDSVQYVPTALLLVAN